MTRRENGIAAFAGGIGNLAGGITCAHDGFHWVFGALCLALIAFGAGRMLGAEE